MMFRIGAAVRGAAALVAAALVAASCAGGSTYSQSSLSASAPELAPASDYHLGQADRVRVIVFGEQTLTGEYAVNSSGEISMPLIGNVAASGKTTSELSREVELKLRDGYLNNPQVSTEVLTFRPFFILGEVNKPGEYPYSNGLTVLNAIAMAQGFTYRADKNKVLVRHEGAPQESETPITPTLRVQPGDTIRIGERYF